MFGGIDYRVLCLRRCRDSWHEGRYTEGDPFVTCALAMLVVLPCYCEYHVHQKPSSVTNLLCAADLESYFKEVCISSSNVVMRFHDQGMRYIMINDEESKVSRYGESICLSTNQSMRVVNSLGDSCPHWRKVIENRINAAVLLWFVKWEFDAGKILECGRY